MDPDASDESSQPRGRLKDMGQKSSKKTKKAPKTAPQNDRDLISDSSADNDSPSKKKGNVLVENDLPPQHVKDGDLACSMSHSNRSSDQSPDVESENVARFAALSLKNGGNIKDGSSVEEIACKVPLILDDESDSGGEDENQNPALCEFTSHVNNQLSSISSDSADAQPSELLTDDESDIDVHLVNDKPHLGDSSPEKLNELSISDLSIDPMERWSPRDSISDLSSDESSQSDDESFQDDESRDPSPCPQETPIPESESDDLDAKEKAQSATTTSKTRQGLPVKAFYIPRENIIPDTKDATVKSTAFERIKLVKKSKLFSNVLTVDTIRQVNSVQKAWRSIYHLTDITQWQKLLSFGEPILMNFKLIELKSSFKMVINKSDFKLCSLIFEVLGEITRSKFEAHKAELFKELAIPQYIRNLHSIIEKCHKTRPKQDQLNRFIENFVDIYGDIFLQLDSLASDGLAEDLGGLIRSCSLLVESSDGQSGAEQLQQLSTIIESRATLIRANSSFPFNVLKEESVESNIIDGPYDSPDHYLTVHYRLMKEDFQNSLRAGVKDHLMVVHGLKRKTINYHLNVFTNVTLATHLTAFMVKYKIIFSDPNVLKKIRDPASPNFLTGSILMLTNTHFQDYFLVRVEDRSPLEREKSHIFVSMVLSPPDLLRNRTVHFSVMAEPSRLFEPYYRVLNVLRSINGHDFPFLRYIVDVKTDVFPPSFMKPDTKLKIDSYTCNLWENETWPSPENVGLNPVQLEGLKQALRNELAIIQGPPGTGKTYLSKKIIEILLQNKSLWHKDDGAGLIMVVCFKNQSLDQLLTGLIKDKVKVLRIGTQSKEEMLDAYNLKTLDDPKFSMMYKKMRWLLADEQKKLLNDLNDSLEIVDEISAHSGIIKLKYFSHLLCLSENNQEYLKANYEKWLLEIPIVEPDFRAVENILGEQTWTENTDYLKEQSEVYQTTLLDVVYLLERVNAKLDVLKELGSSDFVDLLTSAAVYLVQKQKFMEDRIYELKIAMTDEERMELYTFKMEFEGGEGQPPLGELPVHQRWLLYKAWMHDLFQHHSTLIESIAAKSSSNNQRYVEIEELLNMRKISQCDAEVVGLTTTAAAKYFKMMDCLKPKIVLVEEAAEVMEAHTVASLSKFCEHLILVGDHKQLRPLTSSHIIGKEAHLDVSLYERLVKNGFQPCTLNTQYRMRTDIADLIRPAVYKELFDDPSVSEYPNVLGVTANVYFVDHTVNEDMTLDIFSRWNKHEAEFHLALCNYLVLQGYQPSQITILATYAEQERYFNREKLNYPQLDEVLMATVDSFQGKENDIILLSLVRSNAEAVIGFLAQENRINVALSRAKVGLFITGNKSNLLARDGLWTRVVRVLQKKKAIGPKLPLKCQIHGKVTLVAHPNDIKALRNGGCAKQCKVQLPCGHKCTHLCHPLDRQHEIRYKCLTPCNKLMDCSHRCTLTCHSTNPLIFKCFCRSCPADCLAPLLCGHLCKAKAHEEDVEHQSSHRCPEICNEKLPCGHTCVSLCHPEDMNHKNAFKCPIECEGTLMCGHECSRKFLKNHPCSDHNDLCSVECATALPCGHICHQTCHLTDRDHQNEFRCIKCDESQEKLKTATESTRLENKNHNLDFACPHGRSSAGECKEKCGFQYPCGHSCDKRCLHAADKSHQKPCDRMCNSTLDCGHKCATLCHFKWFPHNPANSGSWNCKVCEKAPKKISSSSSVSHDSESTLDQSHTVEDPNQECGFKLKCGHICVRKRGTHIHNTDANASICKRECGASLICGHSCKLRCHFKSTWLHDAADSCGECKKDVDTSWRAGSWMQARKVELHKLPPKKVANEAVCSHGTAMILDCDRECGFKYKCDHICRDKCRHTAGKVHPNCCAELCNAFLDCGHHCKLPCHFSTAPHNSWDRCSDCLKAKLLAGGDISKMGEHHEINHEYTGSVLLEVCFHGNILKYGCRKRCMALLKCGHTCRERCFHQRDPKHLRDCLSPCGAFLSCGHICQVPCHFKILRHQPTDRCMGCQSSKPKEQSCLHGKSSKSGCNLPCNFPYKCGHKCAEKCQHIPLSSHNQTCTQNCNQVVPCSNPCTTGSHLQCPEDSAEYEKSLGTSYQSLNPEEPLIYCTHKKLMLRCNENCPGKLACGHKCFTKLRKTAHPCSKHLEAAANMCQKKCKTIMPCSHTCSGKCHMGSELHVCKKCDSSSFLLSTKSKPFIKTAVDIEDHASENDAWYDGANGNS